MTFVSLFAGIGGFDLGLERAGHTPVGQIEIDPFNQKVLEKHWPDVPRIPDVKTFEGHEFGPFDMLVGGYPCQPFSTAGHRKGTNDDRHLWPEILRVVRNVRPKYVLLENVPGHLSLGFNQVLGDLAESGYDTEWDCIPAAAVGAPHRRDRLFALAYPNSQHAHRSHHQEHRQTLSRQGQQPARSSTTRSDRRRQVLDSGRQHDVRVRRERQPTPRVPPLFGTARGLAWTTQPRLDGMAYGVSRGMDVHPTERLTAVGNAVVPQVAQWIGERLPA